MVAGLPSEEINRCLKIKTGIALSNMYSDIYGKRYFDSNPHIDNMSYEIALKTVNVKGIIGILETLIKEKENHEN